VRPRLLTIFCLVYLGLVLYGSLMPWEFTFDRNIGADEWRHVWGYWPFGHTEHTSLPDVVSNLLLYMPLGGLLAVRWTIRTATAAARPARRIAVFRAVIVCSSLSATVEFAQLFLPRTSSAQDWLMNTMGGFSGACAGAAFGARFWNAAVVWIEDRWQRRPLVLAAVGIAGLLAIDAVLPLIPTLDVSQVWHNIKASHVALGTGFAVHPWHHWLVERAGVYGALAAILGGCSLRPSRRRWIDAALVTTCFALALELAKPFIVSRSANAMNVLSSAAGAAVGAILAAAFSRRLTVQTKAALATAAIALYIVYLELTPFNFAWNSRYIAKKWPVGSEWLPLFSYALRGSMEDVRSFVRGIALSAAFIYCLCMWTGWLRRGTRIGRLLAAAFVTGALGAALEAAQFLLPDYAVGRTIVPGRTPSTSDVFCYAAGGALGALVWTMVSHAGPALPPYEQPGNFAARDVKK